MKNQPDPRVPILREIQDDGTEVIHRESNDINLWLDANFGTTEFTPEKNSEGWAQMINWWDWCSDVFKPMIDLYKYGENREMDREKHVIHEKQLGEMVQKLEDELEEKDYLVENRLTLVDIAIIPFVRQIMRTRNGEFDLGPYPNVLRWTNSILETLWFRDIVMKK